MIKQTSSLASDIDADDNDLYESEEDDNNIKSIRPGNIIQGRFLVQEMIGEGSFGQVFRVQDQNQNNQVMAIKVEDDGEETSMLEREIKVLIEMRKKQGFPQIKFYGQERGFIYCIMGLLGRNLESLLKKCGGVFNLPTVLRIGIQIFNRIELLHGSRFIHRDIKPDNFVLGNGAQINIVHMIDFGLSKYYQNSKGDHIPSCKKAGLIGTARYASVNAHEEQEQSRRDDLESIGYILIYMATGSLPWMNLQIESKDLKYAKIHQLKKTIKIDQLCGKLPKCIHQYMQSVKALSFKQLPNYKEYKQSFQDELDKLLFISKSQFFFDWEKLTEYQQKKKHMTVHLMQTLDEKVAEKKDIQVSPIKDIKKEENQSPLVEKQRPALLQIDKFDQILEKKNKQQSPRKITNSPTRKHKKPIMINIIEVQQQNEQEIGSPSASPMFEQGQFQRQQYQHPNTYLAPPQGSQLNYKDYYPPSVATSKMMNYENVSEDIVSEGALPIWNVNRAGGILSSGLLSHEMNNGIKKPTVLLTRKSTKSHTQVDTLKNISKTFIQPKQMNIQGDESVLDECE